MTKISIITPVYCVEDDIRTCLNSILNQDFQDWELILVDDCSPDNCGVICDEYAKKDPRIRVIHHKKNGGAAKARRTGIQASAGEYIGFVDADDWIEADMYSLLLEKIEEYGADIVSCSYFIDTKKRQRAKSNTGNIAKLSKMDVLEALHTENGSVSCMLWDKLYRRNVLADYDNDNEIDIGEDYSLLVKTIEQCSNILCVDIPLYHYRQRSDSVCNAGFTDKRWPSIESFFSFREELLSRYPQMEDILNTFCLIQEMAVLVSMTKNNSYDKSVIQRVTDDVRCKYESLFRVKYCPLRFKLSAIMVLVSPKLLLLAGKVRYTIQRKELY